MLPTSNSRGGYNRFDNNADPEVGDAAYSTDHRTRHREMIEQQNSGLENLANVISRQKELAVGIGREVEHHNDLIEDITVMADHTHDRLRRETNQVQAIDRKAGTCYYWIVIIGLAVLIVAICFIPFH